VASRVFIWPVLAANWFHSPAQKLNFGARDTRLHGPERKRQDIGDFFNRTNLP